MIVKEYKKNKTVRYIVKTPYGLCDQTKQDYNKGRIPTILCAIDKTDFFVKKIKEIHNDRYEYKNFRYVNNSTKSLITCLIHGDFEQTPQEHLSGGGCPQCGIETRSKKRTKTTIQFIEKAKEIHKEKYNYSLVVYENNSTKIKIICTEHGEFEQTPANHLKNQGCPKCGCIKKGFSQQLSQEFVINSCEKVHNGLYNYSKVVYSGMKNFIKIICPVHGEFQQRAESHLKGNGCYLCNGGFSRSSYINPTPSGSYLYLLLINLEDGFQFTKLGISKNIKERANCIKKEFNQKSVLKIKTIQILYQYFNKDSGVIFDLEKKYKRKFKNYKYIPNIKFAGSTECFNYRDHQIILDNLKKELKN